MLTSELTGQTFLSSHVMNTGKTQSLIKFDRLLVKKKKKDRFSDSFEFMTIITMINKRIQFKKFY